MVFYQFAHCEEVGGGGSTVIEGRVEVRALSVVAGRREWAVVFLVLGRGVQQPMLWSALLQDLYGTDDRWQMDIVRQQRRGRRQEVKSRGRSESKRKKDGGTILPTYPSPPLFVERMEKGRCPACSQYHQSNSPVHQTLGLCDLTRNRSILLQCLDANR